MEYNITYRKKDKGWQYIVTAKEGNEWKYKGSKQGFATKATAKIAADARVEELKEKEEIQDEALPEYKGLTFESLAVAYKKHRTIYQEANTVIHLESALNYFTVLDKIPVEDITSLDIQRCMDGMVEKGLAAASIEGYLRDIKLAFDYAVNLYKVIKNNPVQGGITIPKKEKSKKQKIRALNKKELETLLSRIEYPKHHLASLIMAKCGLRIGELVGLTWDVVDFKAGQLTVDKQWKKLKGGAWGFGSPKGNNSYRTIPVPPVVIAELIKFKSVYPVHISNRIFPYSTSQIPSGNLARLYRRLGFDISVHDLRHTYATTLIANGLDFKTVAKLMGHDVQETIKTYSHVTSDMMEAATKLINSIL